MDLFGTVFILIGFLLCGVVVCSTYHELYDPYDPKKTQFAHKPKMKYITKLSCGQVIARLWTEAYGLYYKFTKEEDGTYTFTINSLQGVVWGYTPGSAKYKVYITSESEGSAVWFIIFDYKADEHSLNAIAWELRRFLEKKLEAVRVE